MSSDERDLIDTVREIESRSGGRIGIAIHDLGSGRRWQYRSDERFPISSTFKPFACAALLLKVDKGKESLSRQIPIRPADIVTYSPITEKHIDSNGLSLAQLCEATITLSDNTAGNLILQAIGGPLGFTSFMQTIGDNETRLDRWETALNDAIPGDPRDTTTPQAAAESLETLFLGDILLAPSRDQLADWMRNDKVADALLRATLPDGWQIADKTGAAGNGSRAIIAVMWPPAPTGTRAGTRSATQGPIIASIYMAGTHFSMEERNTAIATIGAALIRATGN